MWQSCELLLTETGWINRCCSQDQQKLRDQALLCLKLLLASGCVVTHSTSSHASSVPNKPRMICLRRPKKKRVRREREREREKERERERERAFMHPSGQPGWTWRLAILWSNGHGSQQSGYAHRSTGGCCLMSHDYHYRCTHIRYHAYCCPGYCRVHSQAYPWLTSVLSFTAYVSV